MSGKGGSPNRSEAVQAWSMIMASRTPTSCRRKTLRRWRAKRARIARPSDAPHPARRFAALTHHRLRSATGARQWKRGTELRRCCGQDGPMWSRGEVVPRLRRGEKELRRSRREETGVLRRAEAEPRQRSRIMLTNRGKGRSRGGADAQPRRRSAE